MPMLLATALIASNQVSTPAVAIAQNTPPALPVGAPPPPAPALDPAPFRFLVGHWRGRGRFGPGGGAVSSTMTFELASRTTLLLRAAEDTPNTYRYAATWSREKGSGELVMLMSSSLDGPALLHSRGWQGDRLIFEPRPGLETGPSTVRFTYFKRSETAFELTYEFSAGGAWYLCDRQLFEKVTDG